MVVPDLDALIKSVSDKLAAAAVAAMAAGCVVSKTTSGKPCSVLPNTPARACAARLDPPIPRTTTRANPWPRMSRAHVVSSSRFSFSQSGASNQPKRLPTMDRISGVAPHNDTSRV